MKPRLGLGAAVAAVIFALALGGSLGFLTVEETRVDPTEEELAQATQELADVRSTLVTLREQNEHLTSQLDITIQQLRALDVIPVVTGTVPSVVVVRPSPEDEEEPPTTSPPPSSPQSVPTTQQPNTEEPAESEDPEELVNLPCLPILSC